jgi:DNA-binding beta-propeller fold protein YncE
VETPTESSSCATARPHRITTRSCTRARGGGHAPARIVATLLWIAVASASAHAITLADPAHFDVTHTFTPGLATPFGGLRFSSDGSLLYAVAAADGTSSAVRVMAVMRDASGEVTSLGAPVTIFTGASPDVDPAGIDAGLEFGPSGTLFYGYFPSAFLAERPFGIAGAQ